MVRINMGVSAVFALDGGRKHQQSKLQLSGPAWAQVGVHGMQQYGAWWWWW